VLTELQKSRIRYHLDVTYRTAYDEVEANFRLQLDNIDPERELALVGNQATKDYSYLGVPLCQVGSILYKVEKAFENLSPDVIDTTLFVKATEEITLNANELRKRQQFYDAMVSQLRNSFNLPDEGCISYYGNGSSWHID
jgi:hypothetical protein